MDRCNHDPESKVLTIWFKNEKEYQFADVPDEVFDGLISAESAGTYFGKEIKGKYQAPPPKDEA